ncbi:MAG: hypothetical protein AAGA80_16185 [Cyanobacteria bacterium P01_F01_bin.143]
MKEKKEPDNRRIEIKDGNYIESVDGNYIKGNVYYSVHNQTSLSQQESRNRQKLLQKVKKTYRPKKNGQQTLIHISLEERLDFLDPTVISEVETPEDFRRVLNSDEKIIDIFNEQGTLLILGEPGAGKTTALELLFRDLVRIAEDNPNKPIPIIFNLSSWNGKQRIVNWLVQQFHKGIYLIRPKISKPLIENENLVLLLDGLDEVRLEYQALCIQAINEFRREYTNTEIVVCSRLKDYKRMSGLTESGNDENSEAEKEEESQNYSTKIQRPTNGLKFSSAIQLQSLTEESITNYLDSVDRDIEPLKQSILEDKTLKELVKSPLMLDIIVRTYKDSSSIEKLRNINSNQEARKNLFNQYINRMFFRYRESNRSNRKIKSYREDKSKHWLTWLAQRMQQESQSIFLIEQMQPSLLLTRPQRWMYRILAYLLSGLLVSLNCTFIGLLIGFLVGGLGVASADWGEIIYLSLFGGFIGLVFGFIYGAFFLGFVTLELPERFNTWVYYLAEGESLEDDNFWKKIKTILKNNHPWDILKAIFLGFLGLNKLETHKAPKAFIWYFIGFLVIGQFEKIIGIEGNIVSPIAWSAIYFALRNPIIHFKPIQPVESLAFTFTNTSQEFSKLKVISDWLKDILRKLWVKSYSQIISHVPGIIIYLLILIFFAILYSSSFLGIILWVLGGIISVILGSLMINLPVVIVGPDLKEKTTPNEGIRNSLQFTLISSIIVLVPLILMIIAQVIGLLSNFAIAGLLIVAEIICLIFWMRFGLGKAGIAIIQHLALRIVIFRNGYQPWNYARFLDYADEIIFMKKRSGGYEFFHPLLRNHFAQLEETKAPSWQKDKDKLKHLWNRAWDKLVNGVRNDVENWLETMPQPIEIGKEIQLRLPLSVENNTNKISEELSANIQDGTSIINIFDQKAIDGKLLIVGAPESGKTTTIMKLARELIARAEGENNNQPVPVLFNLSSWQNKKSVFFWIKKKQTLKEWLLSEIELNYGIEKYITQQWLKKQKISLFLYGLDKLKLEHREGCIQAINEFLESNFCPKHLVVCSRTEEYKLCSTKLNLNATISLQPLTEAQIYQYLEQVGCLELWRTIQGDSNLLELAKSPLILNILALTTPEISIQELGQFNTTEKLRQYLFNTYVKSMMVKEIEHDYNSGEETPEIKTRRWLGWLAKNLKKEDKTEFSIYTMQPSWLQTWTQKLIYRFSSGLILGFVLGVVIQATVEFSPGLYTGINEGLIWSPIIGLVFGIIYGGFTGIKLGLFAGFIAVALGGTGIISWLIIGGAIILTVFVSVEFWILTILLIPIKLILIKLVEKIRLDTLQSSSLKIRNRIIYSLIISLAIGVFGGLGISQLATGIVLFLWIGLFIGFIWALIPISACIQYLVLRGILRWNDFTPWNYSKFLDYATKRQLMQKIGIRYKFIHDSLQDYFLRQYLSSK